LNTPSAGTSVETSVETSDGRRLYARSWAALAPRGVVCLIHGFGEHVGRYTHVAAQLAEAGFSVFGFDQRGHGRSPGRRGYAKSYDQLLDDIDAAVGQARKFVPGVPCFLWAHSMGGGEALNYLLRGRPNAAGLAGAVVTSPWLGLREPPARYAHPVARLFARAWPTFAVGLAHERGRLSHDPAVDAAYFSDPYVHGKITAPLFLGLTRAGAWARNHADRLGRPLLLMHGTADQVTCPAATREFAASTPRGLCTFIPWEGLYHELHNEYEGAEVVARGIDWMRGQLLGAATASAVTR